ncbi:putative ribonuclease H-like domain-containing protein [Tanacetum coccineum]
MELENSQNNALAKLPMLKLGEYEMWEIRIKQYFQIQDYALWEVIENGNSWVPIPVTVPESGLSTTLKMTVPFTTEKKICKKNDVKARTRFGGNEATKRTQKALLKQQLQKLVSRLAILGVVTPPEDQNVKFLRSLPSEWDIHVVVWMNKPDFDTMGLDDLYNNFKIIEQKVKISTGVINDEKNLAFLTTTGASSINNINTVNPEVSTGTTKVNTASTETSTASFSDATVYAFLSTQPQGSQLVHEDLEQLHDDDLEEMDLKWNMALLSMRARKFYQRTGRKIIIDGSSTAGYDKSKVECFNCHKMGHFARECRAPRSKDNRNWNHGSSSTRQVTWQRKKSETSLHDHSQILSITNDKSGSKSCLKLKKYEALMKLLRDEKVGFEFKITTFEISAKDLDQLVASLVPRLPKEEKKELNNSMVNGSPKGFKLGSKIGERQKNLCPANHVREEELKKDRENNDALIIKDWVLDDEDDVEPIPKVEKKTVIPTATKKEFVKPKKPVRRSVRAWVGLILVYRVYDDLALFSTAPDWIVMQFGMVASYFLVTASLKIFNYAQTSYISTGSREVSTALPEVNTATPEDLVGPSPASEDSHVEVQEIELGNIPQSYVVPTTPHTRIHKDHPIEHVIGDVQSSVQTRRKKQKKFYQALRDPA